MTTLLDKVFGTYLGIEFREDSVVITCLKNSFSGITLLSSSTFLLRETQKPTAEILEYINKDCPDVNKVFVSIPDRWGITAFIEVPSLKGKGKGALSDLMRFEIERHIPFRIEDVAYDFQVLEEKGSVYSIVFVAVRQEKMDYIKDFLEGLSIRPHAVTISSFAVLNVIESGGSPAGGWQEIAGIVRKPDSLGKKGEAVISLCIDKKNINIAIIENGLCIHLKSFLIDESQSAEAFYREISQYLTEAKSLLVIEGYNKLLISGDESSHAGLTIELQDKLGVSAVSTEQLLSFPGNLKGPEMDGIAASIGSCFTGLGISTYKINLLPHKAGYEIKNIAPLTTKIFAVMIIVLLFGIVATGALKQKRFLQRMEERLQQNEPEVRALGKIQSEVSLLEKKRDFLKGVRESDITLEILAELAKILPKDAWLTTLNYKGFDIKERKITGGELLISGFASSSSNLIPILENSPFFKEVEFVGTIKKKKEKEQFKLTAKIVLPSALEGKNEKVGTMVKGRQTDESAD